MKDLSKYTESMRNESYELWLPTSKSPIIHSCDPLFLTHRVLLLQCTTPFSFSLFRWPVRLSVCRTAVNCALPSFLFRVYVRHSVSACTNLI